MIMMSMMLLPEAEEEDWPRSWLWASWWLIGKLMIMMSMLPEAEEEGWLWASWLLVVVGSRALVIGTWLQPTTYKTLSCFIITMTMTMTMMVNPFCFVKILVGSTHNSHYYHP